MSKPIAVIAGDIHYNLNTMHVADKGVRQAIAKANELDVPFISNGDMLDQKAVMRAEYVNMIIETFQTCKIKPYVNVGNHSRINERAPEHALNFLRPYAQVIDVPTYDYDVDSYIIPYDHDPENLTRYLGTLPKGSRLIMHQGIQGAIMGDYVVDKSAVSKEALAPFRAILSHYHSRQDIKCGRPQKNGVGLASYIGNLYSLTWSEASDLPKGFQILMDDGSLEFVPTNLRKHVVIEKEASEIVEVLKGAQGYVPGDLLWVKVKGSKEQLLTLDRTKIADRLCLHGSDFRLDLIPTDTGTTAPEAAERLTDGALLDSLIDSLTNTSEDRKTALKELWRKSAGN